MTLLPVERFESGAIAEDSLPDPAAFDQFFPFLKGVFSQWHPTPLSLEGRVFNTAEQWMMFAKACVFQDEEAGAAIMATADPAEQKRIGQRVRGFDGDLWDAVKIGVVLQGNLAKFSQNVGALRQLRATGEAMLVEANPRDWIWGCGLSAADPAIQTPEAWRGQNCLGRILTRVRDELCGSQ